MVRIMKEAEREKNRNQDEGTTLHQGYVIRGMVRSTNCLFPICNKKNAGTEFSETFIAIDMAAIVKYMIRE